MEEWKASFTYPGRDGGRKPSVSRRGRDSEAFRAAPASGGSATSVRLEARRASLRPVGTSGRTLRILVVDGQPIARLGLCSLLDASGGMRVVGEAGDGWNALRLTRRLRPDVVILGLESDGTANSTTVCSEMKALQTPPRLLVYTSRATSEELAEAVIKGADGYAHKGLKGEQFAEVVRRVGLGECVWMLTSDDANVVEEADPANPAKTCLTKREREVYGLVVKRYSNDEIASRLGTSLYTVKNQVSSILRKLGASSRKQLFGSP